jgi:HNH endonuclease
MTTETTTAKRAKTKAAKLAAYKVRDLLDLDPATRAFTFRKAHGLAAAGDVAGERIMIEGKTYGAARLAVFYLTGNMPAENAKAAEIEAALTEATARALDTNTLAAERLVCLIRYDAKQGRCFRRVASGGQPAGSEAGGINKNGYVYISLDGRAYRRGRLAWLYSKGVWPLQVDHKDGRNDHDRLANLRECSQAQNNMNVRGHSLCGIKGVSFDARRRDKPWDARIYANGRDNFLGCFTTQAEAVAARTAAEAKYHGRFSVARRPETTDAFVAFNDVKLGTMLAEIALADVGAP